MERKEVIPIAVIAGLILILLGIGFVKGFGAEGYAVSQRAQDNRAYNNSKTCSDSDGGIFYSKAGIVKYNVISTLTGKKYVKEYSDKCVSKTLLAEYFCIGNFVRRINAICELECKDNECS